jgi:hypothetical protein
VFVNVGSRKRESCTVTRDACKTRLVSENSHKLNNGRVDVIEKFDLDPSHQSKTFVNFPLFRSTRKGSCTIYELGLAGHLPELSSSIYATRTCHIGEAVQILEGSWSQDCSVGQAMRFEEMVQVSSLD